MLEFRLYDENLDKYTRGLFLDFYSFDDFDDWSWQDTDYRVLMDYMETGKDSCCGVHDGGNAYDDNGKEIFIYSSYEIKDFEMAINKWEQFFKSKNKIIKQ